LEARGRRTEGRGNVAASAGQLMFVCVCLVFVFLYLCTYVHEVLDGFRMFVFLCMCLTVVPTLIRVTHAGCIRISASSRHVTKRGQSAGWLHR
jgi:hypothetical protein